VKQKTETTATLRVTAVSFGYGFGSPGLPLFLGGRCGGRGLKQPVGFVVDLCTRGTEGFTVLTAVVGTEQQLAAAREDRADIGLSTAAVAAVRGRQRLGWGKSSSHVAFLVSGSVA
jgi:hypothetical protein